MYTPHTTAILASFESSVLGDAQNEAEKLHQEWLEAKYTPALANAYNQQMQPLNAAMQRNNALAWQVAAYHGVGFREGELVAVESPLIHLIEVLGSSALKLPPSPRTVDLSACIEATGPIQNVSNRSFESVVVTVRDARSVGYTMVRSRLNQNVPQIFAQTSVQNNAQAYFESSLDTYTKLERTQGIPKILAPANIHALHPTCQQDLRMNKLDGLDSSDQRMKLQGAIDRLDSQHKELTNRILATFGLVLAAALDGDLNPDVVEKMAAATPLVNQTVSSEYMLKSLGDQCFAARLPQLVVPAKNVALDLET